MNISRDMILKRSRISSFKNSFWSAEKCLKFEVFEFPELPVSLHTVWSCHLPDLNITIDTWVVRPRAGNFRFLNTTMSLVMSIKQQECQKLMRALWSSMVIMFWAEVRFVVNDYEPFLNISLDTLLSPNPKRKEVKMLRDSGTTRVLINLKPTHKTISLCLQNKSSNFKLILCF